jgi:type VI secretion system protein ImpL
MSSIWIILLGGLILAAILLAVAFLVLRAAMKTPPEEKSLTILKQHHGASSSVDATFRSALRGLGNRITSRSFRYRLPWVLLFGPANSGKKTIVDFLPHENLHGAEVSSPDGILWGFLRRGVLIKVPGSIFPDPALDQAADQMAGGKPGSRPAPARRDDLWDQVLRQLTRRRPSRPLDAIVVAIAADELLGAAADIAGRAAQIREKLNHLESALGMVLPVYVLITRCDSVQGFTAYCHELDTHDPALKQEIFGWSNEYPIETLFRRMWVDEAMNDIGATLRRQQLVSFGERNDLDRAGELYLFPPALDTLRNPLRILLDKLFARDSYSDSHYFRGVYFCGDPDARQDTAPAGAPAALPGRYSFGRQLAFLSHLFESRIFAETSVARPVPQRFSYRNRIVAAAQVFVVAFSAVMAIGLGVEWRRLHAESARLVPLIGGLTPALKAAREAPGFKRISSTQSPSAAAADQLEQAGDTCAPAVETYPRTGLDRDFVISVLEELAYLHINGFSSLFMPLSHFHSIDDRVDEALTEGFGKVVLKAFEIGLHARYAVLSPLSGVIALPTCSQNSLAAKPAAPQEGSMLTMVGINLQPLDDHTHQQLECYLTEMAALEKNSALYDGLRRRESGNIVDVRHILEYLSGRTLPGDQLYKGNPYFEHAVQNSQGNPIEDIQDHRCRARAETQGLLAGFYRTWFDEAPLATRVDALNEDIREIERSQTKSAADLRALGQSIAELDLLLPSSSVEWIEKPFTRSSIPALAKMEDPVFKDLFSEDLRDEFESQGRAAWMDLRSRLLASSTPQSGPVLETDENNEIRVSGAVRTLGTNLIYLAGVDFMAPAASPTPSPSQRTPIIWNPDLLAEALKLNTSWEKYQRDVLPSVPGGLRAGIRLIARRSLGDSMADVVSRARTPLPGNTPSEDALNTELQNFDQSLDQLKQIYAVSQGLGDSGRSLQNSLNLHLQAIRLLRNINQKISPNAIYSFQRDAIGKWNGTTPMSQAIYSGAESAEDVTDYITADHNRLRTLVDEADPLVQLLTEGGLPAGDDRSSVYWTKLGTDFKQFADKKAGNPIGTLEGFLRTDIDKILPENRCQGGAVDTRAGDPFVDALNGLRTDAVHACLMLVRQRYIKLADNFNSHLAGKFPFAANPAAAEATTNDVSAFFDLYTQTNAGLVESLDRLGASDATIKPKIPDAIAFLQRIADAQPLFATADKNSQPALDVTTQFRSNQGPRETGGNQIIDWELRIGSQIIHYSLAPQTIRWHYGDPVVLSLRYAKDSPNIPLARQPQFGMQIADRTITFGFRQNWALFALLLSHPAGATDFDNPNAPVPNTVRLTFGNAPGSSTAGGSGPPDTVVFTSFIVQAPAAKDAPPAKNTLAIVALPANAPAIP